MMVGYKKLGAVLTAVAVAALALGPATAEAQVPGPDREGFISYSPAIWSFDLRGGVAIPTGDLDDVTDMGASIGAGLAYFLNPRFALRLDGNIDFLQPDDVGGPDAPILRVWSYIGGFEFHVTDPHDGLTFAIDLGGGGSMYWSDRFDLPDQGLTDTRFKKTYPAAQGGARIGVNLGPEARSGARVVNLFVSGTARIIFGTEERTERFAARFPGAQPWDTALIFPIEGGIRINIP